MKYKNTDLEQAPDLKSSYLHVKLEGTKTNIAYSLIDKQKIQNNKIQTRS